ncbi:hypothetical protein [Phyllobacterium lublinensis]|uniref:hypothetical protein n=1 Tax=Phyllobacterium lublinensis TaxID=2875708 RepID=UPI001CCEFB0E|nr:hypothetical protein [Phyllobacterium sp. 2063]MBZ9653580.1 hypothetical protein [Phyllobacterium sp. 2063]
MNQTIRQPIEVICDRLAHLRAMANEDGQAMLAYLIFEALEEAERIRKSGAAAIPEQSSECRDNLPSKTTL